MIEEKDYYVPIVPTDTPVEEEWKGNDQMIGEQR